ncbi:hypothetical protein DHW03_01265 [Pedobacter yonginense]|uniref:Uncharacterized protein n=1 Tax=Pedobacter yonginense TaxID=651869 RepID=A0A317EQU9_9SPHI|nr:hypothetical protein DHW03_01265 [Pedobacter yonginense]
MYNFHQIFGVDNPVKLLIVLLFANNGKIIFEGLLSVLNWIVLFGVEVIMKTVEFVKDQNF